MKPREARRKVFLPARMRSDGQWSDVRVLDISLRGLKLHCAATPSRGAYVEVCRGRERIVARVVWTGEQRFGVRTQDCVLVDAFVNPPEHSGAKRDEAVEVAAAAERRSGARRQEANHQRFAHSRTLAKAIEYGSIVAFGGLAAVVLFGLVQQALSQPLAMVSAALGGN